MPKTFSQSIRFRRNAHGTGSLSRLHNRGPPYQITSDFLSILHRCFEVCFSPSISLKSIQSHHTVLINWQINCLVLMREKEKKALRPQILILRRKINCLVLKLQFAHLQNPFSFIHQRQFLH